MTKLLAQQLDELLARAERGAGLACEGPLRVGAATLSRADTDVTATTVVGAIGPDDHDALEALLAEIADEFNLDVNVVFGVTSFSVRFSRPSRLAQSAAVRCRQSVWTRVVSGLF